MPDTQISEEMMERGAREIFDSAVGLGHWDNEFYSEERIGCFDAARRCLAAALSGHVVVPREPTPAMLRRGSAMKIDTAMAPGHPELKENGGKYSAFELMSLETWRAMIQAAPPEMEG